MRIKAADIIVIILLFCSVFFIKNLFIASGAPVLVLITEKGEKELSFKDQLYDLKEETGHEMIVEVKDGKARIKESDCPNQICVLTGWVSSCGDAAVCIPNKVAVYVKCENEDDGLDAVSR
ncbi:NusG domain II-containing protein [Geovibrio thiophilus]|uniref:NusG domain II-containing protein n=1 Tax=Geovibrio thiophilus TaxID=139438 RepID=A0A410JYV3_9BACT|nr:NusG domain II-containing protein [Geovibrio thiophilus]QAR33357.1 NusG domain II-containing protein [Geovibrio thiophilus]